MTAYAPKRNKAKGGDWLDWPNEIGAAGKRFCPATYKHKGSSESWVSKLPGPSGSAEKGGGKSKPKKSKSKGGY